MAGAGVVVATIDLDEPGQSPEQELPGTSGEEVLIPKSSVSSRSGGLSPCLEIADDGLFKELTAVAVVINRSLRERVGGRDTAARDFSASFSPLPGPHL